MVLVVPISSRSAQRGKLHPPRGEWIDPWSGERFEGGREVIATAPLERIPIWVRSGSIAVTHLADHVAAGLGDAPEAEAARGHPVGAAATRSYGCAPRRRDRDR
ncbi:MAG TPA: hypothetical protein VE401_00500, partial [Solirubrobacterales bacterium]|nr:hypothetical protein [Solirubrobacterales bacterium]